MKKFSTLLALTLSASLTFGSYAKKMSKEEERKFDTVTVTMADGTVHNGVMKDYWTKSITGGFNKEFSITDGSGQKLSMKTADIDSLQFPLRADTLLRTWRVYPIAWPSLFKKDNVENWIAGEGRRTEHARVVVVNNRVKVQIGHMSRWELVTTPCLKLNNDSVAYPYFYTMNGGFNTRVMKHWLNKKNPGLYRHIEAWFKADKKRKKELEKRWSIMLDAVEDYYSNNPDAQ